MDVHKGQGQLGPEMLEDPGWLHGELGAADQSALGEWLSGRFLSIGLHSDGLPPVLLAPEFLSVHRPLTGRGWGCPHPPELLSSHSLHCRH